MPASFGRKLDPFKGFFFDRLRVLERADRAMIKLLSKAGAYVRTDARSSLRRRKRVSRPGETPSVHAESGAFASLKTILFAYDPGTRSVVVGPVALNHVYLDRHRRPLAGTVPRTLEFGGQMGVMEEWTGTGWRRIDLRFRGKKADAAALIAGRSDNLFRNRPIRVRTVKIAERPYMRPSLKRVIPKFSDVLKGSIAA